MYAVRNIRLCTKDCLCLYVCPTGATDTEDGQIDKSKCISGCRACVDACPSHAISLMPEEFPPQQQKEIASMSVMRDIAGSKTKQEQIASEIAKTSGDVVEKTIYKAISMSNRLMAEDILREAGYMLPQSKNAKQLLKSILEQEKSKDFPKETVEKLLETL